MKIVSKTLLVLLITAMYSYAQNGTRLIGFDANSLGRGGTSIGVFDSPELMLTNPAGISFLNNSMLSLDASLMFPSLHFKNNLNDADGDKNTFPLFYLGYVHKNAESKLTWGVGFYTVGGMGADFNLKHALFVDQNGNYQLQKYHSKLASMQGGLSAAYKIDNNFSVGVSLHLVYSMLEFSMPYSLNPSVMQGIAMPGVTFGTVFSAPPPNGFGYDEVTASAQMTDLTAIGFNGKIGFAYKVNDKLSLGLSYTMPTSLTYKNGKASMDMTAQLNNAFGLAVQGYMMQHPGATQQDAMAAVMAQFGQMGIDMSKGVQANYDLEAELKFPQSIGFGLSYDVSENVKLAADFEWLNWANAFDKMTLKLTNGTNSNINTMMGNSGSFNIDFPLNWKNSVVVKVGGEFAVNPELKLKLGYAYGSNPVPESTVFPVFPAIVENHVMAGVSYKVSAPLTINAAFETALNKSLQASNPSVLANEYNGSTSELSTVLVHVSASYAF